MKQVIGVETLKESIELLTDYRRWIGEEQSNRFTKMLLRKVNENIDILERTIGKLESKEEIKTSDEWEKSDLPEMKGTKVLDPDGWDRQNFDFSYYQELITKDEYLHRVGGSTCRWDEDKDYKQDLTMGD